MGKPSEKSLDYYILPNKAMCTVLGMSLTDKKYSISGKIFAYFRLIIGLASVTSIVVPQIMLIAVNWGDLKILTGVFVEYRYGASFVTESGVGCVVTTLVQYIFKVIYILARRERINRLYKELRCLWDSTDNPEERRSYEEFAYWARIFSILFYSLGTWTAVVFGSVAAFDYFTIEYTDNDDVNSRYLPFDVWYGTDVTASPKFEIAFICQFLGMLITGAGIWGIETSCMTTILHVSGQFKLINTWISNLGIEINCEPTDRYRNFLPSVKANLIRCIRHHQRMTDVANEVNNILTPIIFVQILTSGIEICLSGFAVVINNTSGELFKSAIYLMAMTTQLLLWCCPGEILIQESQEIGDTVYLNVPWYKLPPTYRRQLLLIILRSQKYCSITALTFQRLSYQTLTSVFNTAASYFALLRQMQTV